MMIFLHRHHINYTSSCQLKYLCSTTVQQNNFCIFDEKNFKIILGNILTNSKKQKSTFCSSSSSTTERALQTDVLVLKQGTNLN